MHDQLELIKIRVNRQIVLLVQLDFSELQEHQAIRLMFVQQDTIVLQELLLQLQMHDQ